MVLLSTARGRRQRYVPLRRIEVSRGAHDCFVLPGIFSRKNWECPWSWSAIHVINVPPIPGIVSYNLL